MRWAAFQAPLGHLLSPCKLGKKVHAVPQCFLPIGFNCIWQLQGPSFNVDEYDLQLNKFSLLAAALGYFIAAISPNMDMANSALPAYVTVLLFFVGLLMRNQDQPVYWRWFSYLDFLKYAWGAQMINQFEGSKAIALDFQTVG